ncbi:CYTH domain-containing protein [Rheinheimera sp. MMS21-TC3]|uniref:CYTH domain-containing protein n=1 Tax=Rheinheimera sp. MMS21-TC3 TaxID=3072790 RepID=UPI0028C4B94E|nr:CYTH domain-containing protein [Rheinheimera sp. MMS21-TC3]WNO60116.1 CYTH domain-containing protein [Rheinheimera sp. MMS21-TC3]
MTTELELKFSISTEAAEQLPALASEIATIVQTDEAKLVNAYFDTKENWFRQHDFGLRTRKKNANYEQTIKLAGKHHGALQMRPEYNLACSGVIPQLAAFPIEVWPEETANKTAIAQLQQSLIKLFSTNFIRKRWLLQLDDNTKVELVFDLGEVIAEGKSQPISEVELELISGEAKHLFIIARYLMRHLAMRTGWLSKAARGYLLYQDQALTLPTTIGNSLLQQITALQQAEACFLQLQSSSALQFIQQALTAVAGSVHNIKALQQWYDVAMALAKMVQDDASVLESKQYNLLLLAISEYLFTNA